MLHFDAWVVDHGSAYPLVGRKFTMGALRILLGGNADDIKITNVKAAEMGWESAIAPPTLTFPASVAPLDCRILCCPTPPFANC